jgi:hypothetical protein
MKHLRGEEIGAFLRFLAGCALSLLAGWLLFRADVFDPASLWFSCITVGALLAGMLALTRLAKPEQALLLAMGYALVQIGYAWTRGWRSALTEMLASGVLAFGAFVCAILFELLDQEGYRFGKFALLGPLLAGVFVASTFITLVGVPAETDAFATIIREMLVGLVVGDAVGLGAEIVDLAPRFRPGTAAAPEA